MAGNQGRGKDIGTIIEAEREEAAAGAGAETESAAVTGADAEFQPEPEDEEDEEEEEDGYIPPVRKSFAKKKHRKLNSLDISSNDENGDSDEDFKGTRCVASDNSLRSHDFLIIVGIYLTANIESGCQCFSTASCKYFKIRDFLSLSP